jgi:hypothetical protein
MVERERTSHSALDVVGALSVQRVHGYAAIVHKAKAAGVEQVRKGAFISDVRSVRVRLRAQRRLL